MSATTLAAPVAEPPPSDTPTRDVSSPPVLLALVAVLVGLVAAALFFVPDAPQEGSPDVGFARDMSAHHAQAVAMSEAIRDRTTDPELRRLTADIALTQQAQIGMMSAWLDDWGMPQSSVGPRMAWMGMPTTGLMPGMASPQEVQALSTAPVTEAEGAFLRLMVSHHAGGVAMARAGVELAEEPQVRALAQGIAAAQTAEIEYLQSLLTARGLPPAPVPDVMAGMSGESGHGGRDGGPSPRDVALLSIMTLGLVAFAWLLIDAVLRRIGGDQVPVRAAGAALTLAALVSAAVHVILTPEHAAEEPAYGLFFLLTALALSAGAAAVLAGAARAGAGVVGATSILLILTYVAFRIVSPPGAQEPEDIDSWGVVAVTAELVALVASTLLLRRAGARGALRPTQA